MSLSLARDALIRFGAKLHRTPLSRYRVTVARDPDELEEAFRLVHLSYLQKGLSPPAESPMRIGPHHVLQEAVIFVAYEGSEMVGTLTVILDTPALLPLDRDYPLALGDLRRSGARLVEFGSLAVEKGRRRTGVTTLLFMAAHWLARNVLASTHVCVGVNPGAADFYRALFAFGALGPPRPHVELSAPVLGLVHEAPTIPEFFRVHHRRRMETGKTVHHHFMEQLPPCIHIPRTIQKGRAASWRLPRETFREVFMRRSDRAYDLDAGMGRYLRTQRSDETLSFGRAPNTVRTGS